MINADGSYTYSTVARVDIDIKENHLLITPNPVSGKFSIQYSANNTVLQIAIFDEQGKKVREYAPANAIGSLFIDADNFRPGLYFVRMIDKNNKVLTQKFIKR